MRSQHSLLVRGTTLVVSFLTITSVATAAVSLMNSMPAGASNCSTYGSYYDGTPEVAQTNYYAQANITTNQATICALPGADSAAWVAIEGNNQNGFAQAGYQRDGNQSSMVLFDAWESNGPGTYTIHDDYGNAPSGSPQYYVSYNFAAADMTLSMDNGSYTDATNFDPDVDWNAPWAPLWRGETNLTGSNVPGTSSSPTYFSNMKIKTSRGGSVVAPSGLSLTSSESNYKYSWDTIDSEFHIWTS